MQFSLIFNSTEIAYWAFNDGEIFSAAWGKIFSVIKTVFHMMLATFSGLWRLLKNNTPECWLGCSRVRTRDNVTDPWNFPVSGDVVLEQSLLLKLSWLWAFTSHTLHTHTITNKMLLLSPCCLLLIEEENYAIIMVIGHM